MLKTKKVRKTESVRPSAIRHAKSAKPVSKSSPRVRKSLTPEQRERKNAHDRAVRAAKRGAAPQTVCDFVRRNNEKLAEEAKRLPPVPRDGSGECCVGGCSKCDRVDRCREFARTDRFPKLHPVKPGLVPAELRQAESVPVRRLPSSPIAALGAWVQENLARLEQTKGSGIVRQVFPVPGGVAEVSVCRRVCEYPRPSTVVLPVRLADPTKWFTPDFLNLLASLPARRPIRCGIDFAKPAFDFNDQLVAGHARRGLTWAGEAPDPS